MNGYRIGSAPCEILYTFDWINDHKMNIKYYVGAFSYALYNALSETESRYKHAIHDINMKITGTG